MNKLRDCLIARLRERLPALARHLYPDGKKEGASWRVGSLDINLRTGWWGDWDGSTPHMSRNLVDLWIYATGTPFKTALTEISAWLGLSESEIEPFRINQQTEPKPKPKLRLPPLARPNDTELQQLCALRSIPMDGLAIAVKRSFLWTYTDPREHVRAWLITDSARKNAVGRRLDGRPWESIGGKKSKTIYGSWGEWPIGLPEAAAYPAIGLVEGGPDFLALIAHAQALGLQDKVTPICMAGAQMSIPQSVLPLFRDKKVQIFVDDDKAGREAAKRWVTQLRPVVAILSRYYFDGLLQTDGTPVKDLNDLCRLCPGQINTKAFRELLEFGRSKWPAEF
jgi:hypothetical protein